MAEDQLPPSLQESIIALLMFDATVGSTIAAQVRPEHFDAPYQDIATKVIAYRRRYGRPPGKAQLDDLFGWALETGARAPRLKRLVGGIVELKDGLNPEFVLSRTQGFIRRQTLKATLVAASERYQQGGDDDLVPDVERILYEGLRARQQTIDTGTFLSDTKRSLRFLDRRAPLFPIGIKELDGIGLGIDPGELLLYIAPKNSGKSWFGVHMGKQGLIHKGRVLHISLEMPEEQVTQRYYQSLFGYAKREDAYKQAKFEYDELGRLYGIKQRDRRPKFSFDNPANVKALRGKIKSWGLRFGSLLVKSFPSGTLTMTQLTAYLDYLADVEHFEPNLLIIDYPDLMYIDPRNQRLETGRIYVELRGLGKSRNMGVIAPTQGNRSSLTAKKVGSSMVSEDISKTFTADNVLTYSKTPAEARMNTARLFVEYARHTRVGDTVVISQSYTTGQYALESALMSSAYWNTVTSKDPDADSEA